MRAGAAPEKPNNICGSACALHKAIRGHRLSKHWRLLRGAPSRSEGYAGDGRELPMLRVGLRLVMGLSIAGADNITIARAIRPFPSVEDMVKRANLSMPDCQALAKASTLIEFAGHRRRAAGMRSDRKSVV